MNPLLPHGPIPDSVRPNKKEIVLAHVAKLLSSLNVLIGIHLVYLFLFNGSKPCWLYIFSSSRTNRWKHYADQSENTAYYKEGEKHLEVERIHDGGWLEQNCLGEKVTITWAEG